MYSGEYLDGVRHFLFFIGVCKLLSRYLNDIDIKSSVGVVCKSKSFGDFKIVSYSDSKNVLIEFINTGFLTSTRSDCVRDGRVRDRLTSSVFGVGVIGDKRNLKIDGVATKEYNLWYTMLQRCFDEHSKGVLETYKDCTVSENFKSYEYFYDWCNNQVGFNIFDENDKPFEIDKDLLIKGNKLYSENTCVFLPREINVALTKSNKTRGDYPIGVHWSSTKKVFIAQINKGGGSQKHLGQFDTELEAFNAYKQAKESYLKELANKWSGKVDTRAYDALMNYLVEITD